MWVLTHTSLPGYFWSRDGMWRRDLESALCFRHEYQAVSLRHNLHGAVVTPKPVREIK